LDAACRPHYNERLLFLPPPFGNKIVSMRSATTLVASFVAIAGCGAESDSPAQPIMTQAVHDHYHVHAADASHGHEHDDAKLGHDHPHKHGDQVSEPKP